MDTAHPHAEDRVIGQPETEAERHSRLASEAAEITQADAALDAGRYIDASDMRAWVESIGTNQELPPPSARKR